MKYPDLFWMSFASVAVISIILGKLCYDFWCNTKYNIQRFKDTVHLKILAILYLLFAIIRFIFSMIGYVKFIFISSIIGQNIAVIVPFLLILFLLLWLKSTFINTVHEISTLKITVAIIFNCIRFILRLINIYLYYFYDPFDAQMDMILSTITMIIDLSIMIWIVFAFNTRLCKLLITSDGEENEDDDIQLEKTQFVQLLTRQTIVFFVFFVLDFIEFTVEIFGIAVPDKYNHNEWRIVRNIFGIIKVILVYVLFQWHAWHPSDTIILLNNRMDSDTFSTMEVTVAK